jgi:hypothetical protein
MTNDLSHQRLILKKPLVGNFDLHFTKANLFDTKELQGRHLHCTALRLQLSAKATFTSFH